MNRFVRAACLAALPLLTVPAAASAAPKLSATPKLQASRLVVTVTSARAFTARTRPRAVAVSAGAATYKLKAGKRTARKSVWRSATLPTDQAAGLNGKALKIKVKTRAGTVTKTKMLPAVQAPQGVSPAPPTPAAPGPAPPAVPGITLTRNDDAGRQLVSGDLLLERADIGNYTQTYYRIFLYSNGVYRYEKADWNQVSGEICDSSARREGTWSFGEAYTFPERGGGVAMVINLVTNGQSSREILVFGNAEPNNVYVGTQGIQFARNPNMRDQC
jgi:hypothetical protein